MALAGHKLPVADSRGSRGVEAVRGQTQRGESGEMDCEDGVVRAWGEGTG